MDGERMIADGSDVVAVLNSRRIALHMSAWKTAMMAEESGCISRTQGMHILSGRLKTSPRMDTFLGLADALDLEVVVRARRQDGR